MSRFGGLGNKFVNRFSEFGPQSRGGYGASPSMEGATPPPIGAVIGANEEAYRQKQIAYNLARNSAPITAEDRQRAYDILSQSAKASASSRRDMMNRYSPNWDIMRKDTAILSGNPSSISDEDVRNTVIGPRIASQQASTVSPYQQRAQNLKTAYLSNAPLSEIESQQANNTMRQGLVNAEIGEINSRTGLNQAQVDNLRRMGPIQAGAAGRQGMLDTLTMPAKVIGAYRQAFAPTPMSPAAYKASADRYVADQRLAGQQYTADARAAGSANTDQMKALQEHLKTLQDYIRKNHKGAITPELEGILGLGQQQQGQPSASGSPAATSTQFQEGVPVKGPDGRMQVKRGGVWMYAE